MEMWAIAMTRRRKQTVRRHLGNTCVPDDVGEVEWTDDPSVVKAAKDLQHRWDRWLAAKKLIDDDWRRDAERQIAAVTDSVQAGLLMNQLEAERESNEQADAITTEKYFDELLAIRERVWKQQAKAKLAAATAKINRDIARKDRSVRELLKARRKRL
jgi:hypothetical protein